MAIMTYLILTVVTGIFVTNIIIIQQNDKLFNMLENQPDEPEVEAEDTE